MFTDSLIQTRGTVSCIDNYFNFLSAELRRDVTMG
jgi:hypothetical protein